jgi:hypothetical protein
VNEELKMIWKEAIMQAYRHLLAGAEENRGEPLNKPGAPTKIRTEYFP